MTTLDLARQAAKIAKQFHDRVTIKYDGHIYSICIGYTCRDDDRAYYAICQALGNNHGLDVCADISGWGVKVIETI